MKQLIKRIFKRDASKYEKSNQSDVPNVEKTPYVILGGEEGVRWRRDHRASVMPIALTSAMIAQQKP